MSITRASTLIEFSSQDSISVLSQFRHRPNDAGNFFVMNNLNSFYLRNSIISDPVISNLYYSSFLFASWDSESCMVMVRDNQASSTLNIRGNMIMSQNSIIKTENNGDYTFNSAILDEN